MKKTLQNVEDAELQKEQELLDMKTALTRAEKDLRKALETQGEKERKKLQEINQMHERNLKIYKSKQGIEKSNEKKAKEDEKFKEESQSRRAEIDADEGLRVADLEAECFDLETELGTIKKTVLKMKRDVEHAMSIKEDVSQEDNAGRSQKRKTNAANATFGPEKEKIAQKSLAIVKEQQKEGPQTGGAGGTADLPMDLPYRRQYVPNNLELTAKQLYRQVRE
jgi:hypothetical protein